MIVVGMGIDDVRPIAASEDLLELSLIGAMIRGDISESMSTSAFWDWIAVRLHRRSVPTQ